jgi:adenylosuccinate synthase
VRSRLFVSEACPLIMPFHVAVDKAREAQREECGDGKIGTTGKGIGPAYEDKVARRALRVQDLKHPDRFARKLRELLDVHNATLVRLKAQPLEFQPIYDQAMQVAELIKPMMADVGYALHKAHQAGAKLLFEGAQGTLLDIDHGTYPFVTSSNCVAGNAAAGTGVGPDQLHYILGITKAYTTRVGSGPFPTELDILEEGGVGHHLSVIGQERGTVTGRARRCGWLDAAPSSSTASRACASPSSTCSMACRRSRSAPATSSMAATSTSCPATPTTWRAASRSTRATRAGRRRPSA